MNKVQNIVFLLLGVVIGMAGTIGFRHVQRAQAVRTLPSLADRSTHPAADELSGVILSRRDGRLHTEILGGMGTPHKDFQSLLAEDRAFGIDDSIWAIYFEPGVTMEDLESTLHTFHALRCAEVFPRPFLLWQACWPMNQSPVKPDRSKLDLPASALSGYETVADLIPEGHFLRFTCLWALRVEHCLAADFELERRLVLDLGESFKLDERPLIRLTLVHPHQYSIPDTRDIVGLAIEDIRSMGYELARFRVYDYEFSELDVLCSSVALSRASKPQWE